MVKLDVFSEQELLQPYGNPAASMSAEENKEGAQKVRILDGAEIEEAIEEALNAACFSIQTRMNQTNGGVAGIFFTGERREEFDALFRDYIDLERSYAE